MPTLYDVVKHNVNGFSKLFTNQNAQSREMAKKNNEREKDIVNGLALILRMIKCVKKRSRWTDKSTYERASV